MTPLSQAPMSQKLINLFGGACSLDNDHCAIGFNLWQSSFGFGEHDRENLLQSLSSVLHWK